MKLGQLYDLIDELRSQLGKTRALNYELQREKYELQRKNYELQQDMQSLEEANIKEIEQLQHALAECEEQGWHQH